MPGRGVEGPAAVRGCTVTMDRRHAYREGGDRHCIECAGMEDDPVHAPEYRIVWASDVEARPVRWLWRERIPIGGLTLLVGRGGRGKSTIVVELAARLSNGQLDGDLKGEPVEVAYFSAEDGREFVLKPRITAAGADDYRVGFPELLDESGAPRPVTLPADVDLVRRVLGETEVRLVVFDPVVAYLDRHVNSWKDQDVRRVLAPLAALAEDLDVAVAGIVHLTKSPTTDLIDRVGGSSGFANAARSVLAADYHPDHPDGKEHVLVHAKSNWGVHAPTLRYGDRELAGTSKAKAARQIKTSGIVWLGEDAEVTAGNMLVREDPEERGAKAEAMEWLAAELADGPREVKEIQTAAKGAGIAEMTLKRAKGALGVESDKTPGFGGPWMWRLPEGGHISEGGSPSGPRPSRNPRSAPKGVKEGSRVSATRRRPRGFRPPFGSIPLSAQVNVEEDQGDRLREIETPLVDPGTAPPCPRCGHPVVHFLSGGCPRVGCTACPQTA